MTSTLAIGPMDRIPPDAPSFRTSRGLLRLLVLGRVAIGDVLGRRMMLPIPRPEDRPPWHMGILVAVDEVVHLTMRGVHVDSIEAFGRGERIYRIAPAVRPAAAVAVARRRVGERGTYRLLRHNCVDFARSCANAMDVRG